MADIDLLPARGIPRMALVDANGVATNGSSTVAQLAAKGMRSACAVDGSGNATTGSGTMLQLAQRGIKAFCPVDETGVALDASTADVLRRRGIRPMVLLNNSGVALTGSATMLTLAQRGLESFCPLDESGNATTMGAVVLLSNSTIPDTSTSGTNVGTLSVSGGTGTYTFTLTSNPGSLFVTAGTNGVNLNTAATLVAGSYPITVQAAGGVPTPISRVFNVTVTGLAPSNSVKPAISGTPTVGNTLTASTGTWAGSATITYAYQWNRGGVPIGGATAATYLLVAADYAAVMTVTVTATNGVGSAPATSLGTTAVAGIAPANTVAPVISGSPLSGSILTVTNNGTWTGVPAPSFAYQWKSGATNVGTNSASYTLVTGDIGANITCVVTATNSAGNASATSNALGPVTGTAPTSTPTYFILGF